MKLNSFIFNDILPLLSYESDFNNLLELSLISKSVFKIIQNIINYQQKSLNITLFSSIDHLINYLKQNQQCEFNNNKLIKIKNINYIQCKYNDEEFFKRVNEYYYESEEIIEKIKMCKDRIIKLGYNTDLKIHITKDLYSEYFDDDVLFGIKDLNDYTQNGLFSYQRLWIDVTLSPIRHIPISNGIEYNDINNNNFNIISNNSIDYNFSWEFLNKFQPKKVNIQSRDGTKIINNGFYNLLNYSFIESLKFINQPTNLNFIKKALNSSTIKSISFNIPNNQAEETINVFQELSNNKTLKKLSINLKNNQQVLSFFKILKSSGNTTLNQLNINGYCYLNNDYYIPLKVLKEIPITITSLHYFIGESHNIKQLDNYLMLLNENSNIKTFKLIIEYSYFNHDSFITRFIIPSFNKFFNENKSLEILLITINYSINDYNLENVQILELQLYKALKNSNNNTIELITKINNFIQP